MYEGTTYVYSGSSDDSSPCATPPGDDVQVWCVRLRRDRELVLRARTFLGKDERVRAEKFHSSELSDDFVVSRGLLRVLLSRLECAAPADFSFKYGAHGKPALDRDLSWSLGFNVSHSGGILACAFARGAEVGIDIEFQRSGVEYDRIAQRFFSPAEHRELMSVDEAMRDVAFYDCWVRKEAFVKALGGGFSIPLDSFQVSLAPGHAAALLHVRDTPGEERAWTIHAFSPAPRFSGAVALRDRRKRVRVHRSDAREIFVAAGFL
jgi:4'-phosphopantetheinyl transferase